MALEQFKTQVLLLHSEQSTLDALGAGFSVSDKYAVHFATSGSEALNTLGETPIHVLVSAQELPGMSGLEALREAKKRSPDTVGILLAGSDRDDGLEALVGDKEVFQIMRGAVSADALLNIIESATKQVRMIALSESANDTAANVDHAAPESTGEHIVMETAENGSTIISDGTGRMPALKPERIQVSPGAGGREVDILVLSKDEDFLKTVQDSSRGMHNVHHAHTASQAQEIVRNHKVGVLVTDAAIAGSKVQVLTQALRRDAPRLVAVVAGRRDDGELLMDLINQGQVYRFLLKPVSPGRARLAIEASVKRHLEAPVDAFKGRSTTNAARPAPATAAARSPGPKPASPKPASPKPASAKPAPRPAPTEKTPPKDDLAATGRRKAPVIGPVGSDRPTTPMERKPDGMGLTSDSLGDEPTSRRPVVIGAAAAAVLLLVAGIWFFAGGPDEPAVGDDAVVTDAPASGAATGPADTRERAAAVSESDLPQPVDAGVQDAAEPAYASLLDDARFARDAGRIVAPPGDNAVEHYVAARATAPDNDVIEEELTALITQVLTMAETALLESRAVDAEAALRMVLLADAGNPRLAFLNAQLAQLRLRTTLDNARVAIREARFEDAAELLALAQTFAGEDRTEIGQLTGDLEQARSAQQVDEVLARANQRLAEDRLTKPANNNARYFFELALSNDPGNMAAQQGLDAIAGKLVLRARTAIDNGELDEAQALLDEARGLDPNSGDLEASTAALGVAREQQAAAERQAAITRQEAARQAEAERQAALDRRNAASATLTTVSGDALPDSGNSDDIEAPAADGELPDGGSSFLDAGSAGSAMPENGTAAAPGRSDGEGARISDGRRGEIVAISELKRVNYVAPAYPRSAQRRNISGWVDLSFTVMADGSVAEIEIMDSTPGSVFNDAATDAVAQWRFEPVTEDGFAVAKRAAVRMSFSLE